jgi:4-diphosphocytidyl-2-C-methyl-D-erythritol kinase
MLLDLTSSGDVWTVQAPAKVNLTLRILGRRPDGYHDLESVVAALDWGDTLTLRRGRTLSLRTRGYAVPEGDGNLVVRAARALGRACGTRAGARMDLQKRIPPGRGLGGGSADAAAALAGLNGLWGSRLAVERLAQLGAEVGSDVPLFFGSPVSVMRGRGDRIEAVAARPRWWMVLVWPGEAKSTADVYAAFDRLGAAAAPGPAATDILRVLDRPAADAAPYLVNDLEKAAADIRCTKEGRRALERAGAKAVGMTGSGSAYFALADTREQAQAWADAAGTENVETRVVRLLAGTAQQEKTPCK